MARKKKTKKKDSIWQTLNPFAGSSSKGRSGKRQRHIWRDLVLKRLIPPAIALVLVIWLVWFVATGRYNDMKFTLSEWYLEQTAAHGFVVENILVTGRKHLDAETVKAVINARKGDPIFLFNPAQVREQIEQLSWTKSVRVERRLPDTIAIAITEREPFVFWQHRKRLALIDREGVVLTADNLGRYGTRMIVVGPHAHEHADNLVRLLKGEPDIYETIKSATRVGERRWDLKTTSGVTIRLPENNVGLAVATLARMNREDNVLSRDITLIDLRLEDKVVVRPSTRANAEIERPRFRPSREGDEDI